MTAAPGLRSFDDASALVPAGPGRFDASVDPEWTVGGKPNGGYLLALLGRAGGRVADHHDVVAASAHYLRSPDPGPVTIEVEVLRGGRSASQVRARLESGGRPCVEALLTLSELPTEGEPSWDEGAPGTRPAPIEECFQLQATLPDGNRVAIMDQIDLRLDPATTGFRSGLPTGRGELRGWLAFPGGGSWDPTSLLFALDALPPATFDIRYTGWVPTLELTAYIRAIPAAGPLWVTQRAQLIAAGRVDETCTVWDRRGQLVAQGTQLAAIHL